MLPPPKKVWNRFASKLISKLGRFPRPSESITRTTLRFLSRLGTSDHSGRRRCCRCSCHHQPEYWVQVHRSSWNNNNYNVEVEFEDEDEELEGMEDEAVDEKAEEFIAKFHESLKLERLQYF